MKPAERQLIEITALKDDLAVANLKKTATS